MQGLTREKRKRRRRSRKSQESRRNCGSRGSSVLTQKREISTLKISKSRFKKRRKEGNSI